MQDTGGGDMFSRLRSDEGEEMVLENNIFVEQMFIGGVEQYMSEEDKAEFRRSYEEPGESRRPTLTWPRELSLGGEPKRNDDIVAAHSEWLANESQDIPKLFIRANPGAIFRNPFFTSVRPVHTQPERGDSVRRSFRPGSLRRCHRARIADWIPTLPERT